ncbi:DNRLRE domain-containing protein [Micromonospora sp. NBC_01412]|uniref:golvesin C-terminal-like domain-containing protein n=1 Tax=Micromonospora sp. NBC_01412 TaxID=2903590 RepID=UPI00325167AC
MVATLGGTTVLPGRDTDRSDQAAAHNDDGGLLSRLGEAARDLVGGGSGRTKPEAASAAPAALKKPAEPKVRPPHKRVRELTDKRTATSRVYLMSDGRTQAEISAVPVHYKDAKGRLQPIDTTVRPTSEKGYVQGNRTNTFTSLFGDDSRDLVRFEAGGRSIELGLTGADRTLTPKVSGSTVTYPGLGDNADLVYDVTSTALKEKIVLRQRPDGPVSYTFTLDTAGLTAQQRTDGSIAFVRADGGSPVFVMPPPFMYDSKDDAGSPHGKVWSDQVTQRVQQMYGQTTITVQADGRWLRNPARVYPVVIDPTIKIQPNPGEAQDVELYSGDPDTVGSGWPLSVGTDASHVYRSLLKFPLSSVPAGTALDSAQLKVYYDQTHTTSDYDVAVEARQVTQPWDETTATWTSMSGNFAAAEPNNGDQVDDADTPKVTTAGSWPSSADAGAIGGSLRINRDTTTGDTFTWVPSIPVSGDYLVQVHYVAGSDRTTVPYTVHYSNGQTSTYQVDQRLGSGGVWKTLGTHNFGASAAGQKIVLGDVSDASKAVVADAVRLIRTAVDTKLRNASSRWHTFGVRTTVQSWLDAPTTNHGFMLKAVDEAPLARGGPRYEAAEYAYMAKGQQDNHPKLLLTWGRPGVTLAPPTTVYSTGAQLTWSAYTNPSGDPDGDKIQYQVHRSLKQHFTPSADNLVAPVDAQVTTYTDTSAEPTAADDPDPFGRYYYYMVAVKTRDGTLIPAPTEGARLPKAGRVTRIFQGDSLDTTLSVAKPNNNLNVFDGDPYLGVGNNSPTYGDTRALVKFPTISGIPATAMVVDAQLQLWVTGHSGATSGWIDVHKLNRDFEPKAATWNNANATTAWTTPGGDFDPVAESGFDGANTNPEFGRWTTTATIREWLANPSSNHGFLLKMRDEAANTERTTLLATEGTEDMLRPRLAVSYLEKTSESTYYVPYTPARVLPNDQQTVAVTVSNTTAAAWQAADWVLSYAWTAPDGSPVNASPALQTALPKNVVPGDTVTIDAPFKAPNQSTDGNKRTDYVLTWQLYNKTTGKWLSESDGIPGLSQNVTVEEATSDQLGLEKYYSYAGKNTGAGGTLMNNLYAGNTVWSYNALTNPSRGLSTFVRLAYNSLDTSDTVAGYGWSLQASSLMRLGTPLDFHPNPNPTTVTLTDGDGTSHKFTWDAATSEWKSPAGVHLYLQKVTELDCKPNTEESRAWRLTKPDRTEFFYDCEGYLSTVVDNNGNEMRFTYEERKSNNKPTKFLRYLTDAAGRQTLTVDYYAKGQTYEYIDDTAWTRQSASNLTNPKIIDHVSQITDISGRKLTFTYTDKGLLGELVDGAGSTGPMGEPKVFKFRYDMTQGNKNVKLVKVTDPRGNATDLTYNYPQTGDDPKWHWTTKSYTDRLDHLTQFAYVDPDGPQGSTIHTTVTDAENHATQYQMDGYGRPTQTTNAKNEVTKLGWDSDHNVERLEEANGAVSTWAYDQKTGYPTEIKDAETVRNSWPGTALTYQRQLNGHIADLTEKTSTQGRKWTFGYEPDGDLSWVIDPVGNTTPAADDYKTSYTYDEWGQLLTATDANGNTTTNSDFDPNGYPNTITDAENSQTTFAYDERGQVLKATDALDHDTTQTYDTFGRPLENKVAVDQTANKWITTPAPKYDANDNVYESYAPNGATSTASYDEADQVLYMTAPVDVAGDLERKTSFTYDKVGNLLTATEPKGNLTSTVGDYTTTTAYDAIYQLVSVTNAQSQKITYEYDNVGNVVTVVDPRKNATTDTADYTRKMEYDLAHRVTKSIDALGKFTRSTYDRDGLVTATTDQVGTTTEVTLDPRGKPTQVKVPHKNDAGTITYRVNQYKYDQVGNQTKVVSPRGVATTDDPDDFATVTIYDKLNRVKETRTAYDKDDTRYTSADVTTYTYDAVGRLTTQSAPPSSGESVRNDTTYTYYDNGWTKSSSDPWDIVTSYDYNELGAQTTRTVTSAGGSSNRTMTWSYFPDGKLKSRSDDGVPVGKQVVLVDNSDFNNTTATGTWTTANTATGKYGTNYATAPAGTGTNTFTWQLNVPQSGTYEVFAQYPQVTGAATDATYTISHGNGDTTKTVNQSTNAGAWVRLGSYSFTEGNTHNVSLSDQATGTVVADAIKLVRDNSTDVDNEKHDYSYRYDPNGNLTTITDASPGARVDTYSVDYTDLNQVQTVSESKSGTATNTTTFTYNENSAPLTNTHDKQYASYSYDPRDLVSTVINGKSATDPGKKTTTFTYTDRGEKLKEVKGNGNTVDYTYHLDGLLNTQAEKKPNGTLVSDHTYTYDLNGNRTRDIAKKMNADNHSAYLNTTSDYTYDPRDRLAALTKTGDGAGTETYIHDANNNVINQTIKGTTTTFNYDRNRLLTASTGGATASYNYDPFGRLDTVTAAGTVIERNFYDGFDHVIENRKNNGTSTSTTKYTYDPLDRTTTKTTDAGSSKEKTTTFNYLGLSIEVLDEEVAGKLTKSYQYSPWGQRLSQVTHKDDGTEEKAYYGYDQHADVEQLTDDTGDTKATYGYTAYGKNDDAQFTGIDKPDAADPTKEVYNAYRFNAKRWDQNSQSYDMGFRNYSPGLNRFLTRDNYNGALSDMKLGLNPWTGNRYAFGGGNPISMVEIDGHTVVPIGPAVGAAVAAAAAAGAAAAVGAAAAAAAPWIAGGAAVVGIAWLLANIDGGDLSADDKADQAGIAGTEEGAEQAAKLAEELNGTRRKWLAKNGTTAVVKVWDSETNTYKIKVSAAQPDPGEDVMPEGWEEKIRAVYGDEIAIEYVKNSGEGIHAEENIIDSLSDGEVIVEGGANRSVCMYICNAELGPRMQLGGKYASRSRGTTKHRAFWRPFMPWMSPPASTAPAGPSVPNPAPAPVP